MRRFFYILHLRYFVNMTRAKRIAPLFLVAVLLNACGDYEQSASDLPRAACLIQTGDRFVAVRLANSLKYDLPGGKRDTVNGELESPHATAEREVFEELGLNVSAYAVLGNFHDTVLLACSEIDAPRHGHMTPQEIAEVVTLNVNALPAAVEWRGEWTFNYLSTH